MKENKKNKRNKRNKKNVVIVILALLIVSIITVGTVSWLTKTSSITNTFTVGTIEVPTTSPTDSSVTINIDGNIYEPSWDANEEHKLIPGVSFKKDPYVGIGKGSEDSAVYVYVENNFSNKVYFSLNNGWEAVDADNGSETDTYTSGLFKYTSGLVGNNESDTWTTTPLFSNVVVADDAEISDLSVADGKDTTIKVSAFLHQAKDSDGNAIDDDTILAAAKNTFNIS